MPRQYVKAGSLSAAALIALLGSAAFAQQSEQQSFESICSWIEEQTDPVEITRMIDSLTSSGGGGVFSSDEGQNYQVVCTTLAGQRLALQVGAIQGEAGQQAN